MGWSDLQVGLSVKICGFDVAYPVGFRRGKQYQVRGEKFVTFYLKWQWSILLLFLLLRWKLAERFNVFDSCKSVCFMFVMKIYLKTRKKQNGVWEKHTICNKLRHTKNTVYLKNISHANIFPFLFDNTPRIREHVNLSVIYLPVRLVTLEVLY